MSTPDTVTTGPALSRPGGGKTRGRGGIATGQRLNELGLLGAIAILFAVLGMTADGFLTSDNQLGILRDAATVGIAATGVTLVIIAGEIDISIGPAVAFASVILAKATSEWGLSVPLAVALTLALGTTLGALAGGLRAYLAVPSFIATLGLWSVLRGLGQQITEALPVPLPENGFFETLGGDIAGIPTPAIIMVVLFVLFAVIAKRTAYGRSVFAIGGNANAARLSGIDLKRVRIALFATTGFLSALTGLLLAARLGSGNGGAAGGLEFDVIAAVVIGGTALAGGRGSLLGTFLGVIFITLIGNGLVLLGVDPFFQDVVRGVIIVGAVVINLLVARRSPTAGREA
ncbi:ABC transporter permease [Conexibacter arvalis]|uniref:Simple sugar transport system permease protein n=1 Tax=Conexibacter arvalis TaxID=912552 RepID=A0A840IF49_9ACTN|nr:ABC transporter permease [Conexibacter arvalis]MBB4662823.1 simple sugar transport system permease protein [Conexibacter arvalis]